MRSLPKRGRPKTPFDWNMLDAMLGLNASISYCAEQMLVAVGKEASWRSIRAQERRITREINKRFRTNFVAFRDKRMEPLRLKLFQKQLELAMKGDRTMLVWMGKQLLDQKESPLIEQNHTALSTIYNVDAEDKHTTTDLINMLMEREPMRVLNPSQCDDIDDICGKQEVE